VAGPDRPDRLSALWVVDGNNVMGSRPDGWWRDRRGAAERLTARLRAHAWPEDTEVLVIFDGSGPSEGPGQGPVQVAYAGGGRSADDAIVDLVGAQPERSRTVFTSDRDLARRCGSAGAAVVGSGALLRRLDGGPPS